MNHSHKGSLEKGPTPISQAEHLSLNTIFEQLPGFIYWKDTYSRYLGFNEQVVQLSGLTRTELYGKTDDEIPWGQELANLFKSDDHYVIKSGKIHTSEYTLPIQTLSGYWIHVRAEKSPLRNKQGQIIGVLGVALDITREHALAQSLEKECIASKTSRQLNEALIRNQDHDVYTPYRGALSLSKSCLQQETDPQKKHNLSLLCQFLKHLYAYYESMFHLSRLTTLQQMSLIGPINLKSLIVQLIELEQPAIQQSKVQFSWTYDELIPDNLEGNALYVQQLLIDLMGYAINLVPGGEIALTVSRINQFSSTSSPDSIIIEFQVEHTEVNECAYKDTTSNTKGHVIRRKIMHYPGTQLTLKLIREIVGTLGGALHVGPKKGVKSLITCTLPFQRLLHTLCR